MRDSEGGRKGAADWSGRLERHSTIIPQSADYAIGDDERNSS
ncbi:MAG: hypothetical protein RJS97_00705 [Parvibaculaceae bacterium]